jgi:hypothetical protein
VYVELESESADDEEVLAGVEAAEGDDEAVFSSDGAELAWCPPPLPPVPFDVDPDGFSDSSSLVGAADVLSFSCEEEEGVSTLLLVFGVEEDEICFDELEADAAVSSVWVAAVADCVVEDVEVVEAAAEEEKEEEEEKDESKKT